MQTTKHVRYAGCIMVPSSNPPCRSHRNHFYLVYKPMIGFVAFFGIFGKFWVPYSIEILEFGVDNELIGTFLDWFGVDF